MSVSVTGEYSDETLNVNANVGFIGDEFTANNITTTITSDNLNIDNRFEVVNSHKLDITTERCDMKFNSNIGGIKSTASKNIVMNSNKGSGYISVENCVNIKSTTKNVMIESSNSEIIMKSHDDTSLRSTRENINLQSYKNINITTGTDYKTNVNGVLDANEVWQMHYLLVPTGTVVPFAGEIQPGGWLLCNGASYNSSDYFTLFTIIGYKYGGSGSTFYVPNLCGRTPIGAGTGDGLTARTLAATGGEEQHTLTTNEMPSHNHEIHDPGHTHTYNNQSNTTNPAVSLTTTDVADDGNVSHTTSNSTTGIIIQNRGGDAAHNIMQPYLVLNFIIKY
jgi:microcystin-dependent protein